MHRVHVHLHDPQQQQGYANVGIYGVGVGVGMGVGMGVGVGAAGAAAQPPAARWRALYARRPLRPIADQVQPAENIYESVNAGAGVGAGVGAGGAGVGGAGGSYWWWRVGGAGGSVPLPALGRGCRHARASQTLEFNERAARTQNNDYQGTMPRANRAGRAGPAPEAEAEADAEAEAERRACAHPRLSASCGTIHVDLPPCLLLVPRWRAPAPPAHPHPPHNAHAPLPHAHPRPSCSYHLLPESHRVLPFVCHQSTSRDCCSDSESDMRDEEGVPSDSESDFASRPASPAPAPGPSAPSAPRPSGPPTAPRPAPEAPARSPDPDDD